MVNVLHFIALAAALCDVSLLLSNNIFINKSLAADVTNPPKPRPGGSNTSTSTSTKK